MSLSQALQSSVSGSTRFSKETALIGDNLANVDTNSFKAKIGLASTYVTGSDSSTSFNSGGSDLNVRHTNDVQGSISKTNNASDFAFDGAGYAAVRTSLDEANGKFLFTRKTDFSPNEQGYLVNSDGLYLHAWRLDADGHIPDANQEISS